MCRVLKEIISIVIFIMCRCLVACNLAREDSVGHDSVIRPLMGRNSVGRHLTD